MAWPKHDLSVKAGLPSSPFNVSGLTRFAWFPPLACFMISSLIFPIIQNILTSFELQWPMKQLILICGLISTFLTFCDETRLNFSSSRSNFKKGATGKEWSVVLIQYSFQLQSCCNSLWNSHAFTVKLLYCNCISPITSLLLTFNIDCFRSKTSKEVIIILGHTKNILIKKN